MHQKSVILRFLHNAKIKAFIQDYAVTSATAVQNGNLSPKFNPDEVSLY